MKTKLITLLLLFIPIVAWAEPSPNPAPDKLQSALADMVSKSVQVAGDAKDFLVAQLPDVIRQLLWWKFAESIWKMIVTAIFLLVIAKICKRIRKYGKDHNWRYINADDEGEAFGQTILLVVSHVGLIAASIITLCSLNVTWLQIWVAPKVYLIEYSKTFITGH